MPTKPDRAADELRQAIARGAKARVGVIIVDSNVKPLRMGTVGQTIGVAGLEPVIDCRGQYDLYGKPLRITFRALADQLATAAQLVMGEAAERVPAAIVRGVGVELAEKPKRSPKISPKRCIYFNGLKLSKKS
jgi:F420-0:gamma-glutamyl ligase